MTQYKSRFLTRLSACLAAFLVVFALAACTAQSLPVTASAVPQAEAPAASPAAAQFSPPAPSATIPAATVPPQPAASPTNPAPTFAASPTLAPPTALPPEPQVVEFPSEDGFALSGLYYPAAESPAPLVVLMHWAPGDQDDWVEIAFWLQNRGLAGTSPDVRTKSWLDPVWFPAMPAERSLAVFSFTFRGCEGGCKSFDRSAWLQDAYAAMRFASSLPNVDSQRIVAMGASIGADGVTDGCLWLNQQALGNCLGALSLSPGGYLTVPYSQAVADLGALPSPVLVWCLYAQGDTESVAACESASGAHYRPLSYSGSNHGMLLLQPDVDPDPLALILEFLDQVLGK